MSTDNNIIFDPRALRVQLDLNQQEFWSAIGVTQSGGSRYENDRRIPKPVMELLRLRYQLGIPLDGITLDNAPIIRAIASGELDTETLRDNVERIQAVLCASEALAKEAAKLSTAAEALLSRR
ncbi:helix-turn-helix domain-containing protein [Paludibacterium yongneupense]|uniref:helix-turn-helix domain-containing protein n=1 Tax=Paludibacterium yongneupense TaxID=400061 RepID=UPI0012EC1066|nr:helix-turn-helix transcriptional regulator [Paludibacterium yongneupense]